MNNDNTQNNTEPTLKNDNESTSKPDDYAGMYIRGYIKITDPESGEVLAENN